MAINDNPLNKSFSLILSYLDSVIKEQKIKAHNAIDMPDWEEAQKVLISANQNISLISSWKVSLANIQSEIMQSGIIECNDDVTNTNNTDDNTKLEESSAFSKDKSKENSTTENINYENALEEDDTSDKEYEKHEDTEYESVIDELGNKDIVEFCEDMILHNPYQMAIIDSEPNIGLKFTFTYNENDAKIKMTEPVQLSNGLWVESDASDNEIRYAIQNITNYCRCNKHNLI